MADISTTPGPVFPVRDFGAAGDGAACDTAAVQRAIDTCAERGGGSVLLHAGTFRCGSLILKSHVTLSLSSSATLLASTDIADYYLDRKYAYLGGRLSHAFIYAEECESTGIIGPGAIVGSGAHFAASKPRPVLLRFRRCTRAVLRDVQFRDYAAWGAHFLQCRDVRVDGVTIDSYVNANNDGIDLEGCERVLISNCAICSGDDSIALKTVDREWPCRDVVVTNCILSSGCAGIRFGPESKASFERIAVSNCTIRDTGLNGIKLQMAHGAAMRDIVFSNVAMDNVTGPISIRLGGWDANGTLSADLDDAGWEQGTLRHILFDNIRARVSAGYMAGTPHAQEMAGTERSCISIAGTPEARPDGITFSNVSITFPGGGTIEDAERRDIPERPRQYPEMFMFGVLPAYGLYARHARNITLHNVRFELAAPDARPAVVADDVDGLDVVGLRADCSPDTDALIHLTSTRDAYIGDSRPCSNVNAFLRVARDDSGHIVLGSNDFALARHAVEFSRGASPSAVRRLRDGA